MVVVGCVVRGGGVISGVVSGDGVVSIGGVLNNSGGGVSNVGVVSCDECVFIDGVSSSVVSGVVVSGDGMMVVLVVVVVVFWFCKVTTVVVVVGLVMMVVEIRGGDRNGSENGCRSVGSSGDGGMGVFVGVVSAWVMIRRGLGCC